MQMMSYRELMKPLAGCSCSGWELQWLGKLELRKDELVLSYLELMKPLAVAALAGCSYAGWESWSCAGCR